MTVKNRFMQKESENTRIKEKKWEIKPIQTNYMYFKENSSSIETCNHPVNASKIAE